MKVFNAEWHKSTFAHSGLMLMLLKQTKCTIMKRCRAHSWCFYNTCNQNSNSHNAPNWIWIGPIWPIPDSTQKKGLCRIGTSLHKTSGLHKTSLICLNVLRSVIQYFVLCSCNAVERRTTPAGKALLTSKNMASPKAAVTWLLVETVHLKNLWILKKLHQWYISG